MASAESQNATAEENFFSFKSPNLQIKNIRQGEEKLVVEITQLKILDRNTAN